MDPGMPMMPDPTTGGMPTVLPGSAGAPAIDPQKLAMIRQLLMQRMGAGGGMPSAGMQPPMLGMPPQRPQAAPPMYPGMPPMGMSGPRG